MLGWKDKNDLTSHFPQRNDNTPLPDMGRDWRKGLLAILLLITIITIITSELPSESLAAPTLTINSVVGSSATITITYTTTGDYATSALTTTNRQYSRDGSTWNEIDSTAIGNNGAKAPGSSNITWDTTEGTNNLGGVYDTSVYFRMKVVDGSQNVDGNWVTKASMPTSRSGLAVGVVNGKIYAIGGQNTNNNYLATVEEYDPATDMWTTKASMPTGRHGLSIGVVGDKIYAIGGSIGGPTYITTVEEYDPNTDQWATKASMPTGRTVLAVGMVNNKIYSIGGWSGISSLATVEEYDPATDMWTTKASMPTGRFNLAAGVVNNKIYAIGGSGFLTTNEEYNPVANQWTTKASMPSGPDSLAVGVVNNKVYAIERSPGATVEEYDPATNQWATKSPMPTSRSGLAVGVVNNKIYAIGGAKEPAGTPLTTLEEFTPPGVYSPYTISSSFLIDNNASPPSVTISAFGTTGPITIDYTLSDADNSPLSILRQYSTNGGSTWSSATVIGTTSNILPANYIGSITWDSVADLPGYGESVQFRITPSDGEGAGTPGTAIFTLDNVAPTAVTLNTPTNVEETTLDLSWSQSTDEDFESYKVYYSKSAGVSESSTLATTITDKTTTTYTVTVLTKGTQYYFKVYVVDIGGLSTGSNEKGVKTWQHWRTVAPMPTARSGLAVGVINGKIYAIGGTNGTKSLDTIEEYDPLADQWRARASIPTERYMLAVGVVNNKLYAIGGCNDSFCSPWFPSPYSRRV